VLAAPKDVKRSLDLLIGRPNAGTRLPACPERDQVEVFGLLVPRRHPITACPSAECKRRR